MRLKLIEKSVLDETSKKAATSERLRMNHNFHELSDNLQRMLNAIEPDSYVRPHRHLNPPKVEVFLMLRGRGAIFLFDDDGKIIDSAILEPGGRTPGVEIAPGQIHTIVSLEKGTIIFEVKDGPYIAVTDKDFASFAPAPEETLAAKEYLKGLKDHLLNKSQSKK
ncbi:MAG: WbuC family cupin fold metalloprotein [Thermodesulfobacteriota bacterium]